MAQKVIMGLGVIIMLLGLGLLLYTYNIEGTTEAVVTESNNKAVDCYLNGECGDNSYTEKESKELLRGITPEANSEDEDMLDLGITEDMIGVFYSKDIDLVEPIYSGATFNNLARGIATVDTNNTFEDQNINIAGHRVEGPDIRFNRAGELELGDILTIGTVNEEGKEELTDYKISEKYIVSESAVEVMEQSPGEPQIITLITCEGYDSITNTWDERLIIKAEIVS